jgi:hypothetical protein
MAEIVDDSRTGLHFEPGDAASLARKLLFFWNDRALQSRMRLACRQEFEARYTAAENYRQLMDIYRRARGEGPASRQQVTSPSAADSGDLLRSTGHANSIYSA